MRKLLLLLIPAVLIASGCMSPEQRLVGKWRGKVETNALVKAAAGPMSGFIDILEPQLDLKPDKSFSLALGPAPIEGSWRLDEQKNEVVLTPRTMMGVSTDDVKKRAEKEFDRAGKELDKMKKDAPFTLPFSMDGKGLPDMSEIKVRLDEKQERMTLDPAAGTFLAGFGKINFKKA